MYRGVYLTLSLSGSVSLTLFLVRNELKSRNTLTDIRYVHAARVHDVTMHLHNEQYAELTEPPSLSLSLFLSLFVSSVCLFLRASARTYSVYVCENRFSYISLMNAV